MTRFHPLAVVFLLPAVGLSVGWSLAPEPAGPRAVWYALATSPVAPESTTVSAIVPTDPKPEFEPRCVAPRPRRVPPGPTAVSVLQVNDALAGFKRAARNREFDLEAARQELTYVVDLHTDARLRIGRLDPDAIAEREELAARMKELEALVERLEARLVALKEPPSPEERARELGGVRQKLEALGPAAKPALREFARSDDPAVAAACATALEHIRREQLWKLFAAAIDKADADPKTRDLFEDLLNLPGVPERLERVADGNEDARDTYDDWRDELNAAVAGNGPNRRPVPPAEVAAWLLLGTLRAAKPPPENRPRHDFLDPSANPELATAARGSHPFYWLLGEWAANQQGTARDTVQRLLR